MIRLLGLLSRGGLFLPCCLASVLLPARAMAAIDSCNLPAVQAAAPPGMTIGSIANTELDPIPKAESGVVDVAANLLGDGAPQYCLITGKFVTNPQTHKTANFAAFLPEKAYWNRKFLFEGCGGHCGNIKVYGPPAAAQLKKGYPVWITDDGHEGKVGPSPRLHAGVDSSYAVLSPGHLNQDAVIDYEYRAVHKLTELGKQFTLRYYAAQQLARSYFVGCSDGGREAMVELTRFPADYDGIVAGAPFFDMTATLTATLIGIQAQLRSPKAAVPADLLRATSAIVTAKCDATDGVKDGLIQNPARCDFNPQRDLPICGSASNSDACFTRDQVHTLDIIFSASTDPEGRTLFPGYSISHADQDLTKWLVFPAKADSLKGPDPWSAHPGDQPLGWYVANGTIRTLVFRGAPEFNALESLGISFRQDNTDGMEHWHAVIPKRTVVQLQTNTAAGSAANPADASGFLGQHRKLIMYHGLADGLIPPYRTIQYFRDLAKMHGGYDRLRADAELFLVPGMGHCGGGPGPNYFGQFFRQKGAFGGQPMDDENDVVTAIDSWVEHDKRPTQLIATKYEGDDVSAHVQRAMPLCPYPAEASYQGTGDPNARTSWSCKSDDSRWEELGPTGRQAGLGGR